MRDETRGERVTIEGRVIDGDGAPVTDAMLEIWQANAEGKYDHPDDDQEKLIDPAFPWLRPHRHRCARNVPVSTPSSRGRCPACDGLQAPHINVSIFARGLLKRLVTRIYFPDDPLNATDAVLNAAPRDRRATMIAALERHDASRLRFDVILQGAQRDCFPRHLIWSVMMASTAFDSPILGNLFSTETMREVFLDADIASRFISISKRRWHGSRRGSESFPPMPPTKFPRKRISSTSIWNCFAHRTEVVGSPDHSGGRATDRAMRRAAGQYVHWGATTQDIMDTATAIQIREALALIDADLRAISDSLAKLARRYRDTPMAGRSMLQHAVPITFGLKAAEVLAAIERHRTRLKELRPRVLVGQFGGAVGTLASLGARGLEVQRELMKELQLGEPEIAWHTHRDNYRGGRQASLRW